jgi:hypothetical protein
MLKLRSGSRELKVEKWELSAESCVVGPNRNITVYHTSNKIPTTICMYRPVRDRNLSYSPLST